LSAVKIDVFNHFFPKAFFDRYIAGGAAGKDMGKRMASVKAAVDLDERFRLLDEFGDVRQVLTIAQPPLEAIANPEAAPTLAQIANDGLAELVAKHPDRFVAFGASLPLNNTDACLREIERSVEQLGARGVLVYTNVNGAPLDRPEFQPIFDEVARRDSVVFLHPARGSAFADYGTEDTSLFEIWWMLGWPYETSAAMSRLVFSGLFDRHPGIKILTHHMGGMLPYFSGRAALGWDQLGVRTSDVDYVSLRQSMKKRPVDYFREFYADTALFGGASATACGLDFFGADRCLFASDTPFEPSPGVFIRETIRAIESLGLSDDDKDKIYRRNAERLLKLGAA
jgi:predicted TIM-barrel fold metal-dependent hydrolase